MVDSYAINAPVLFIQDEPVKLMLQDTTSLTLWNIDTDASDNLIFGTNSQPSIATLDPTNNALTVTNLCLLNGVQKVTLKANASAPTQTLTFPPDMGSPGYSLITDGGGNLSWVATVLTSAGGTTLVSDGTGPTLAIKGISAGTGVSLSAAADAITITNSSPASSVNTSDLGAGTSILGTTTGPNLTFKTLVSGTGVSLTNDSNTVTITNSSPGSGVTLTNAGTTSLVSSGTGPALTTKGLVAGTGVSFSTTSTNVTITNSSPASSITLTSLGGTSQIGTGSGAALTLKGLSAGTGVSVTASGTALTIANTDGASTATLSSVGTGTTLVNDGVGPDFAIKSIDGGTGITIGAGVNTMVITNSDPASSATLSSVGTGTTLVNDGVGPDFAIKSIDAGAGITIGAGVSTMVITNNDLGSSVTLANAGAGTSLVASGSGPSLTTRSVSGSGITLSVASSNITFTRDTINFTRKVFWSGLIANDSYVNNLGASTIVARGLFPGKGSIGTLTTVKCIGVMAPGGATPADDSTIEFKQGTNVFASFAILGTQTSYAINTGTATDSNWPTADFVMNVAIATGSISCTAVSALFIFTDTY